MEHVADIGNDDDFCPMGPGDCANDIRSSFSSSDGEDECVDDVEARMSKLDVKFTRGKKPRPQHHSIAEDVKKTHARKQQQVAGLFERYSSLLPRLIHSGLGPEELQEAQATHHANVTQLGRIIVSVTNHRGYNRNTSASRLANEQFVHALMNDFLHTGSTWLPAPEQVEIVLEGPNEILAVATTHHRRAALGLLGVTAETQAGLEAIAGHPTQYVIRLIATLTCFAIQLLTHCHCTQRIHEVDSKSMEPWSLCLPSKLARVTFLNQMLLRHVSGVPLSDGATNEQTASSFYSTLESVLQ
jgi:hypothetical protein